MKLYDLQGIQLEVDAKEAFVYLADARRLPEWTHAFASVKGSRAIMRTPRGEVGVDLVTHMNAQRGTVDTKMTFPDGSTAWAYSRVVPLGPGRCVYTFVLAAPRVPLEEIEGTLDEQSKTLARELRTLKKILEDAREGAATRAP